jgi:hypothetical protein
MRLYGEVLLPPSPGETALVRAGGIRYVPFPAAAIEDAEPVDGGGPPASTAALHGESANSALSSSRGKIRRLGGLAGPVSGALTALTVLAATGLVVLAAGGLETGQVAAKGDLAEVPAAPAAHRPRLSEFAALALAPAARAAALPHAAAPRNETVVAKTPSRGAIVGFSMPPAPAPAASAIATAALTAPAAVDPTLPAPILTLPRTPPDVVAAVPLPVAVAQSPAPVRPAAEPAASTPLAEPVAAASIAASGAVSTAAFAEPTLPAASTRQARIDISQRRGLGAAGPASRPGRPVVIRAAAAPLPAYAAPIQRQLPPPTWAESYLERFR